MSENIPSFIEDIPTQPDPKPGRTRVLPLYSLNLFRDKIVNLGISENDIDKINVWWRTVDRTNEWVQRARLALTTPDLPKQEKTGVEEILGSISPTFDNINTSLNKLLATKIPKIRQLVRITPKEDSAASDLVNKIDRFDEELKGPLTDQVIAFCEAYRENSNLNDTRTMRMKVAQWAFEEMISLFPKIKMWYQYEGIPEPTTVDQLDIEKDELISALKGELWTTEEVDKWRKIYEQNRKLMGKLRFENDVKNGFEFIFRSALGETSAKYSAIKALIETENVFQGIGSDSTLQEVWNYESEEEE